jgi:hypothetical protein
MLEFQQYTEFTNFKSVNKRKIGKPEYLF